MKIVVLCGGLSTERNISFLSGTKVCRALRKRGHQAVLVDLFMGLEDVEGEPAELFKNLPPLKDLTFDGSAPDLKAYTGSGYLGAAIAMDKMLTKEMVKDKGVRTPAWKTFNAGAITSEEDIVKSAQEIAAKIEAPCVVKTPTGGSSVGVYIVTSQDAVRPAVEKCLGFGPDILVEQMIEGREFTCAVLQDRALPSVEIVPKVDFYNYENKYKAGATEEICPGRCTPEVEKQMGDMALKVHNTLGLRTYSRSDFIVDKYDNAWFLEVNTLPGMTPTSLVPQEAAAVGISYEDLCEIIVNDGLDR